MRISILTIGRMKAGPERELVERYRLRAQNNGKSLGFYGFDCIEINESKARRESDRLREEADILLAKADGARIILFDERFSSPSSEEFSLKLENWNNQSVASVACVIGGADGVASSFREKADWGASFGRLAFPHQIVRILVAEQLYRAMTLLAGHPYHRSGQG